MGVSFETQTYRRVQITPGLTTEMQCQSKPPEIGGGKGSGRSQFRRNGFLHIIGHPRNKKHDRLMEHDVRAGGLAGTGVIVVVLG